MGKLTAVEKMILAAKAKDAKRAAQLKKAAKATEEAEQAAYAARMAAHEKEISRQIKETLAKEEAKRQAQQAPYLEQAYKEAQAGGLDISEAARMERARQMGFDEYPVYHGTNRQFGAFDPHERGAYSSSDTGGNISLTRDFRQAREYAQGDAIKVGDKYYLEVYDPKYDEMVRTEVTPQVMKLRVRGDIKKVDVGKDFNPARMIEAQEQAKREGYAGIQFVGMEDSAYYSALAGPTDTIKIFDPSNLRSIDAVFDPAKRESSDLLANYAPIGLAGALGTGVALQSEDAAADNLTPAQQNALSAAENRLYQDFTPAQRKVLTRAQKRRNAHGASARRRRERERENAQLVQQIERGEISASQLSPEQVEAVQRHRAAQIPELSGISDKITPLQAATLLTTFDPLEAAQLFKQADPALSEVITPEGEVMLYNRNTGAMASINKPGPSKMDAMQGAFTASLFAPAARPAKLTQQALAGMGTAAAIEATQAAQGGEFNPMDVALEGLLPAVGPALKGGLRRVKQWARGVK